MAHPAVELRNIRKVFANVVANDGVNLCVEKGTIHGLIGENGAGKSTTMKILYGLYQPDGGSILIDGSERSWDTPADAIDAGIGMVHQHFMLAGPYTALDNILLGSEPTQGGAFVPRVFRKLDRRRAKEKLQAIATQYGLPVDWDAPVENLPVGIQQRIEILKLLYRDARILILDEPTAVLTPQETNDLFGNLRKLKAEGKTILVVTHKLREVMEFTDRVTVLRAGKITGEVATSETSPQDLADRMVGRKVVLQVEIPEQPKLGASALKFEGVTLKTPESEKPKLKNLNMEIRGGEIVGIAGVEGNGQSELLQALLHPSDPECRTDGSVHVLGKDVTEWDAAGIKAEGVGVIPEDRHRQGLLLERPLTENFILGFQRSPEFDGKGFLRESEILESTMSAIREFDVRPPVPSALAGDLSGGNQQKLIIAREFSRDPGLLIAAQPTRGVDVGAIEFIHKRIVQARQRGAGVLLVSSELDEILSLSDRILVMYEGEFVAEYERGQASERELGLKMGGAH